MTGARWGSLLRSALTAMAALLLSLCLLGGALWAWTGMSGSLATAVQLATQFLPSVLPPGQSLELQGARGVLREGGSLELVRWKQGSQTVEAHDLVLAWDWRALAQGSVRLPQLQVRLLRLDLPGESGPPLVELQLPVHLDVEFAVDALEVVSPTAVQITDLKGNYQYDGETHVWDVRQSRVAAGRYSTQGRLQAAAPMAISAQAGGSVTMPVPNTQTTVDLQAQAAVQGTLSGLEATLNVSGDLQQIAKDAASGKPQRTQPHAQLQAQIHPWQPQPVVRAHARWNALDLAALWPQYPQTRLTGDLTVAPDAEGWKAQAQVQNAAAGPINLQRLPLQSAQALVLYRNGQWLLQSLQAQGAGGNVQAQGRFAGAEPQGTREGTPPLWAASATLSGINPALVDSRLAPLALTGSASAQQLRQGIGFELQMQATGNAPSAKEAAAKSGSGASAGSAAQALMRLKSLQAQGIWSAPTLQLDAFTVQAQDATLQGQLRIQTRTLETSGKLSATAPGLDAVFDGAVGSTQGQGRASLRVQDAAAASIWLSRWPLWTAADAQRLAQLGLQGGGEMTARWQGGWQQQGKALRLEAQLGSNRLEMARPGNPATPLRLSAVQADVSGGLQALVLTLRGKADVGEQAFSLQAQAHGGRVGEGRWDAWIDSAQLSARSTLRQGDWNLRLARSVALQWQKTAAAASLNLAAGSLELGGPVPGTAQIAWQSASWSQKITGASGNPPNAVWQTRGNLQGLPLAWLEILGQTRISNLGLRGDLVFGGEWDAGGGDVLAVRAMLQRTGGDLQLLADEAGNAGAMETLRAGLREARLDLQIRQSDVSAKVLWSSDNAGSANASFTTRLQDTDTGWSWAADAPVAGQVRANLPRVGVWSLLAPPGWRIQGTLDADTALTGTRAEPNWRGTLLARDLSVRSVVDGIDFSQGNLRVRVDGQRLEIEDFSLQGAGGASGGLLQASGSVVWVGAPARVRMALDAVAQNLKVSARADQRLVVSGKLSARLEEERLTVRGALVADQAQVVLPDDTAPKLGTDVVVRPGAKARALAVAKASPARAPGKPQTLALDVDVSLDPGSNFQISGGGARTRLTGLLRLSTGPGTSPTGGTVVPRLNGELRTVAGTYKAYGQTLDIDQGVLRFSGPYDNPVLDILALRPNLQQKVGVQVSGTAQLPVVRLYADPDMPDTDKLSWLLLGRAPVVGGDPDGALFQQAALALLSRSGPSPAAELLGAVGLDEVSLGKASTTNADGTNGASATTVKLGKRLSRDFYVAYERSIASTLGTFYVFYDLSRRFTLRAESGAHSALDLIYTTRFD